MISLLPPFDGAVLLLTLLVTLTAFWVLWLFSLRLNDAGIVDYYWGFGFPVIGWISAVMTGRLDWPVRCCWCFLRSRSGRFASAFT